MTITAKLAEELDDKLEADLKRDGRLGLPKRYLAGDHDLAYMPHGAKPEFKQLAQKAVTNWTPLVPDEFNKGLALDGFRAPKTSDNVDAWRYWQDNGLDARQTICHRGALEYGTSYTLVLPGADKTRPLIRPLSPLRSAAWYADDDDEFPELAIQRMGIKREGDKLRNLFAVYEGNLRRVYSRPSEGGKARFERDEETGLGYIPFHRFRTRLDGESAGLVRPFKLHQDRINEVVFNILMAMQYASFRQRWATGLSIPIDEETGEPVEPFQSAIDRLWVSDSPDARFGDFAQTDIHGHQEEYKAAVATYAAAAQIAPAVLTGDLNNIGNDTLLSLKSGFNRKLDEYKLLFGEAWESVFRTAALAAGSDAPDAAAEVRWRDTSGEVMAAKVDALGKLATMLGAPEEALWEEVPGMTDSKLQRWREAVKADPLSELTAEINRQAANATPAAPAPAEGTGAAEVTAAE
jgi:hypothetical protein